MRYFQQKGLTWRIRERGYHKEFPLNMEDLMNRHAMDTEELRRSISEDEAREDALEGEDKKIARRRESGQIE
jgi:hypothetical protein